jgi:hypothetical protein
MPDFYDPAPVPQADGSTYQWKNCNCASAAMALDRDTEGAHTTTGARVRYLTGDHSEGTTLPQVDVALRKGWPPEDHLDVQMRTAFFDLVEEVARGSGAIVQGGYRAFHNDAPELVGSTGFFGNHSIYLNEVKIVESYNRINLDRSQAYIYDPLWDGRRTWIPDERFRWVPLRLIYNFCAALDLGGNWGLLGHGYAYAGLTKRTPPLDPTIPPPKPIVKIVYGENTMIVSGGIKVSSSHGMALKKGQPLYREPKTGAPVVTKMSVAARVPFVGNAAPGWKAVQVSTSNFPDKTRRPVIVYVPSSAGTVTLNP